MIGFFGTLIARTKTILDRLTAARAAYLDYINTLYALWTATRAGYVDAINTAVARLNADLTTARCANLENVGGYMSVQHFVVAIGNSDTVVNQAITPVSDMARAWPHVTWSINTVGGTVTAKSVWFRARLTSVSNVRIERGASEGGGATVNLDVMEWKSS
jgi:hypothetical protein